MKVSAGMDSMVLGETQILGQVRDSFLEASRLGRRELFLMNYLNKLLHFLNERIQKQKSVQMLYRFHMLQSNLENKYLVH